MAALTVNAARAARAESRLRLDAGELRLAVHRSLRVAAARKERSRTATATATAAQAQRAGPAASPWSSLEWLADDEDLLRVLVPVD